MHSRRGLADDEERWMDEMEDECERGSEVNKWRGGLIDDVCAV